ncbi:urease accessory protein UreF [Humibacter albus]|uniref:urease accessory protein UreF n=1 Tax=Humibacter albus TaxID=427754 RepID=UPI0003B57D0B|nr:urease accessory UreF family protein [Humibacter albus]
MVTPKDASGPASLLISLQLSDSAFPSGFYAMSHGLEGFHQQGLVDGDTIGDLLEDILVRTAGPGDATALARTHGAAVRQDWDHVAELDRLLFASKLNSELRRSSTRSGRQLIDIVSEAYAGTHGGDDIATWAEWVRSRRTPGCQAIATGVCYAATGVAVEQAVVSDLFAFAISFAGAALRLRLTDHRSTQKLLRRVQPVIEEVAADAVARPEADIGGFTPVGDIMSAGHERAPARLFTS